MGKQSERVEFDYEIRLDEKLRAQFDYVFRLDKIKREKKGAEPKGRKEDQITGSKTNSVTHTSVLGTVACL